jgi:hypothetical protein
MPSGAKLYNVIIYFVAEMPIQFSFLPPFWSFRAINAHDAFLRWILSNLFYHHSVTARETRPSYLATIAMLTAQILTTIMGFPFLSGPLVAIMTVPIIPCS